MLTRTNVGDYVVTAIQPIPGAPSFWAVHQKHHDYLAEAIGEEPHLCVGMGQCFDHCVAVAQAIDHAIAVIDAADLLERSIALDARLGVRYASQRTVRLLGEYDEVTGRVLGITRSLN